MQSILPKPLRQKNKEVTDSTQKVLQTNSMYQYENLEEDILDANVQILNIPKHDI